MLPVFSGHRMRRQGSDDGVAVVVALMVTVIAFLIVTAILGQSIHNIVQTGYSRRRLAAVNAAEAGLNWYANRMSRTSLTAITSSTYGWSYDRSGGGWWTKSAQDAATAPEQATFELRVIYSESSPCGEIGDPSTCTLDLVPLPGLDLRTYAGRDAATFPNPIYAVVRSIGTAGSATRALEAYVRLRAGMTVVAGGLSAISLCLGSGAKISVYGDLAINNQAPPEGFPNAYHDNCRETYDDRSGNIVIDQGKYLRTVRSAASGGALGSLLIRGGGLKSTLNRHVEIDGNLEVEKKIQLGCDSGSACVRDETLTCPTDERMQCVRGDAQGSDIFLGPHAYVQGGQVLCATCPPDAFFTEIRWNANEWNGWDIIPISSVPSMDQLEIYIEQARVPTVLHITASCAASQIPIPTKTGGRSVTLYTSVAIVSECGYVFSNPGVILQPTGACGDCALLVLSVIPSGLTADDMNISRCGNPGSWGGGNRSISMDGNQEINTGLFLYTPCYMWISGNNYASAATEPTPYDPYEGGGGGTVGGSEYWVKGQFVAHWLIVKGALRMIQNDIGNYLQTLPGQVSSFEQDVKFVREISVDAALNNLEGG